MMIKDWIKDGTVVIDLYGHNEWKDSISVVAKIDTGADSTSIHDGLCETLGWEVVGSKKIRNANGKNRRELFSGTIGIGNDVFEEVMVNGADRSKLKYAAIIGRNLLNFLLEE